MYSANHSTTPAISMTHAVAVPHVTFSLREMTAIIAAFCFALAGLTPSLHAQDTTRSVNPPAVNVALPAPVQGDEYDDDDDELADSRWPMRFTIPQGLLTVYQPQLTGFDDNKMTGRAAVSIKTPESEAPVFGAIWLASRVSTDRAARTVKIIDVQVERVRIPEMENIPQEALGNALTEAFKREPMKLSLDQLIAMVERVNQDALAVKDLNDAPPKIVFINNPAVLVQFDGEPRFVQSDQVNLLRAVNTPFFVVLDQQIKRYYLNAAGRWFIAREATGPWLELDAVPAYVTQLAKATGYIDPEADLAQAQIDQKIDTPAIITATVPTELVWTLGGEELSPIEDTNLLYVTNTDSDIILDIDSQKIYVLLSGRWYRSSTRSGPWEYVSPDALPTDFARIPATSDKGSVLAHIAGTQMAKDALADNYVPQTASIDRRDYEQPAVEYDGEPRFEQIERLRINYAVNTPNAVLQIDGRYYVCYNAVWYRSNFTNGPWELCTSVPSDVYLIPPTSPVYAVRYVRIYDVTPTVIYTGYLPGYVGSYVHHGVVVYGTGYHYRPWIGHTRYYSRPYTWGFTPRYDPYHSYWGFNVGVSVNFGNGFSLQFGSSHYYASSHATWFGFGGYRPNYYHAPHHRSARFDRYVRDHRNHYVPRTQANRNNSRNDNRNDYRDSRDRFERQNAPRRADLNLYERRRDVIGTHTPGKAAQNRDARAERIDRTQRDTRDPNTRGGLTAHDQRLDRNNDGRVDRNERTATSTQNRGDNNTQTNRPNQVDRSDRADRNDRNDRNDTGKVDPKEQPNNANAASDRNNTGRNNTARTRTDSNNVFADENGNVYRKTIDGWERRDRNEWVSGSSNNTAGRSAASSDPAPTRTRTSTDPASTRTGSSASNNRIITTNNGRGASSDHNNSAPTTGKQNTATSNPTDRRTSWPQAATDDSRRVLITPQENTGSTNSKSGDSSSATQSRSRTTTPTRVTTPSRTTTPAAQDRSGSSSGRTSTINRTQNTADPRMQSTDRNSDSSLNADYRARVRGEQRQTIYNQQPTRQTPAARTPTIQSEPAAPARAESRNNARSESRSAAPASESTSRSSSGKSERSSGASSGGSDRGSSESSGSSSRGGKSGK